MTRITLLSTLLLVALTLATGCKSNDAQSMAAVPPPADHGPAITATNTNLYDNPVPSSGITTVTPVDTLTVPALPPAQQDAGNVTFASPNTTSVSGSSYTVRQGDTLWRIASNKYGNGQKWRDIVNANPGLSPSQLRVGQTINLP